MFNEIKQLTDEELEVFSEVGEGIREGMDALDQDAEKNESKDRKFFLIRLDSMVNYDNLDEYYIALMLCDDGRKVYSIATSFDGEDYYWVIGSIMCSKRDIHNKDDIAEMLGRIFLTHLGQRERAEETKKEEMTEKPKNE